MMANEDRLVVELNEDIANVIRKLAKDTNKDVNEVVSDLLEASIKKLSKMFDEDEEELEAVERPSSSLFKDIKETLAIKALSGDSEEKLLYKMMSRNMLYTMIMQQQQMLMNLMKSSMTQNREDVENRRIMRYLIRLTKEIKKLSETQPKVAEELAKSVSKVLAKYLKSSKKREEREALEKKFEELRKIIEKKEKEAEKKELESKFKNLHEEISKIKKALDERINYIQQALAYSSSNQQSDLVTQLQQLRQLRDTVEDLAKMFNIVKEEKITTKEGKIDWGALLSKTIDTVKELGKVALQKPPKPTQVQKLPETSISEEQARAIEKKVEEAREIIKQMQTQVTQSTKQEEEVKPEEVKVEEKVETKEEVKTEEKTEQQTEQVSEPIQEQKVEQSQENQVANEEIFVWEGEKPPAKEEIEKVIEEVKPDKPIVIVDKEGKELYRYEPNKQESGGQTEKAS